MELSPIGQELYDLAGGNHPLEKYIIAIDLNMEDDSALRSIGERIGIYIPDRENSIYYLYSLLKEYLLNETNSERTEKVINMTAEEYNHLKDLSQTNLSPVEFNILYSNRLLEKNY